MRREARERDPVPENRIHNEAIADANGPEERVMGWHDGQSARRLPAANLPHFCALSYNSLLTIRLTLRPYM